MKGFPWKPWNPSKSTTSIARIIFRWVLFWIVEAIAAPCICHCRVQATQHGHMHGVKWVTVHVVLASCVVSRLYMIMLIFDCTMHGGMYTSTCTCMWFCWLTDWNDRRPVPIPILQHMLGHDWSLQLYRLEVEYNLKPGPLQLYTCTSSCAGPLIQLHGKSSQHQNICTIQSRCTCFHLRYVIVNLAD